jgi:hypothetical protein
MMKWTILILCVAFLGVSCSSKNVGIKQSDVNTNQQSIRGEKIVWSSSANRPVWTVIEPNLKDGNMLFTGLSDMHATEKSAREEAMRSALNNVVGYLGVEVKDIFQNIVTRFGLSSEIADPTTASRDFEEQIKNHLVSRVRANEWYIEQWQKKNRDTYWKCYVLVSVPSSEIENIFNNQINEVNNKLEEKITNTKDNKAKQQLKNVMDAFNSLKGSGLLK